MKMKLFFALLLLPLSSTAGWSFPCTPSGVYGFGYGGTITTPVGDVEITEVGVVLVVRNEVRGIGQIHLVDNAGLWGAPGTGYVVQETISEGVIERGDTLGAISFADGVLDSQAGTWTLSFTATWDPPLIQPQQREVGFVTADGCDVLKLHSLSGATSASGEAERQ